MRPYLKPLIMSKKISEIIPTIVLSPVPVFISPIEPIVAAGVVVASILSKKGDKFISRLALVARTNF